MKKLIYYGICFFIAGEILIRVTDRFHVMESNRIQKIDVAIETTDELDMLKANQIDLSDSSLRILVLGDSYIHGGGISPAEKISKQLKKIIKEQNKKYKNVYVLDVSRPDSNNLDNMNTYFSYKDAFKPQIVLLGYHFNDINGNLDETVLASTGEETKAVPAGGQGQMGIQKITNLLYNSAILDYTLPKVQNFALSMGYIIPKSRLDNTIKYYINDHSTWQKSKVYLTRMMDDIKKHDSQLIVYHFAYTNLIEYPELFEDAGGKINEFFSAHDRVTYVSGIDHFRGRKASDYFIYKHDGHPNALAHALISSKINEYILQATAYKSTAIKSGEDEMKMVKNTKE
jgi:lysophospholipase L1-like esterase